MTRVKRIGAAVAVLTLLWAGALLVPTTAGAGSSSFRTAPSNVDHIAANHALAPGDVISVGVIIQAHGRTNRAATLYVVDGQAALGFACRSNGAAQVILTIPLWSGPFAFPANYGATGDGWYPTGRLSNRASYQAATTIPDLCRGGPVYLTNNAETYAGSLGSPDDTADTFSLEFHTAIAPGTNCGSAAQNPTDSHGNGIAACNFNQNGSASAVTPARYSPPPPPPPPTAAPTPSGSSTPPPSSGNVPIPVVFEPVASQPPRPAGSVATLVPVPVLPGSPASSPAPGTAPPSPSSTPVPPVVFNPLAPSAPAQLITAITATWIPIAGVAALLLAVIMAVLFTSRRRHRTGPKA